MNDGFNAVVGQRLLQGAEIVVGEDGQEVPRGRETVP